MDNGFYVVIFKKYYSIYNLCIIIIIHIMAIMFESPSVVIGFKMYITNK